MSIDMWWPELRPETREWLIANNGDAVPRTITEEIEAAGGPGQSDGWWVDQDGSAGSSMPDEAIDWIEEVANEEASAGWRGVSQTP